MKIDKVIVTLNGIVLVEGDTIIAKAIPNSPAASRMFSAIHAAKEDIATHIGKTKDKKPELTEIEIVGMLFTVEDCSDNKFLYSVTATYNYANNTSSLTLEDLDGYTELKDIYSIENFRTERGDEDTCKLVPVDATIYMDISTLGHFDGLTLSCTRNVSKVYIEI